MLSDMELSAVQGRVLGSLIEKALTTPQQYPLTLVALVSACNQSSNRDPVVAFDEETVMAALDALKVLRLVRFVLPSSGRTAVRYRSVIDEVLGLDTAQCALFAVLVLRGPQTVGELRIRTERMAQFDGLEAVEAELEHLATLEVPLAVSQGRRPGQKEGRWACPLVASADAVALERSNDAGVGAPWSSEADDGDVNERPVVRIDRLGALESAVTQLRAELSDVRRDLDQLRANLGD